MKLNLDILLILHNRIESLPPGEYSVGLKAVLQHIQVAVSHHSRGVTQRDDTAFTDAIYRTNQAFEGSLKEAYRVLTGKYPLKVRPFDIETYLQEHGMLRTRVLAQFSNYRTEWRNPSAHDYRLDFDEDEALLAIVSVCAFSVVLIDQIDKKLCFNTAKAATSPIISGAVLTKPLPDIIAESIENFRFLPQMRITQHHVREAEIVGALAGYLSSAIPIVQLELDPIIDKTFIRPDIIISTEKEKVLIEVKRVGKVFLNLNYQYIAQISHYINLTGIKNAIIYVHSDDRENKMIREEHLLSEANARVIIISPKQ